MYLQIAWIHAYSEETKQVANTHNCVIAKDRRAYPGSVVQLLINWKFFYKCISTRAYNSPCSCILRAVACKFNFPAWVIDSDIGVS